MKLLKNHRLRTGLILCFWLCLWQTAALLLSNNILLTGPAETLRALWQLLQTEDFRRSVMTSFLRIGSGFLLSFAAGLLLGAAGYRFPAFGEVLSPAVSLLKSIPVASFIILALIWAGSGRLSALVAGLVVFPTIYIQTVTGLMHTDSRLLEMARVFRMPFLPRLRYLYLPALYPYLYAGLKLSLGMAWKSGIAAEIIGVPTHSIGEHLYLSKVYLETADVFAWTIVIILLSFLCEKVFLFLLSRTVPGGIREHKDQSSL